jgi:hypothetical protein
MPDKRQRQYSRNKSENGQETGLVGFLPVFL